MLKNVSNLYHKIMTLVDKVVVDHDIYSRCQLSIKPICRDIHSSIEKYEESQSAILFLL